MKQRNKTFLFIHTNAVGSCHITCHCVNESTASSVWANRLNEAHPQYTLHTTLHK